MENGLVAFLNSTLEERGWSLNELGRRAGISHSTISMVLSGDRQPGLKFCVQIAQALKMPPEKLLRVAGLLPPLPGIDEDVRFSEILDVMRRLDPDEREDVLRYAIWKYEQQEGG